MNFTFMGTLKESTTVASNILKYNLDDLDILIGETIYQGIKIYNNPFKYFTIEYDLGKWTLNYNSNLPLFMDEIIDLSKKIKQAIFLMDLLNNDPDFIKNKKSYKGDTSNGK